MQYGIILFFVIFAIAFVVAVLLFSRWLSPYRPNEEKNTPYECGEEPVVAQNPTFTPRFYVVALIFLVFEVELLFLFPWSIVFGNQAAKQASEGLWQKFVLVEMAIFIFVLAIGLAYIWHKGYIQWFSEYSQKSPINSPKTTTFTMEDYKKFNSSITQKQ